jgi:hypothetical protein
VKEMRNVYKTRACEWRRLFWPQENSKKTELSTDVRMDAQPLKEALLEGDIASTITLSAL